MAIIEVSKQITNYLDSEQTASAPANPVEGQRWTDTSKSPPVAMIYTEGDWKPERLSVEVLDPDFYQDLEDTKTEVAAAIEKAEAAEKAGKDAQAAGEAAQSAASEAKQAGENAANLATQAALDAQEAKAKADAIQIDVNGLVSDVATINGTVTAISSKANEAYEKAAAVEGRTATLETSVTGLTGRMTDIETTSTSTTKKLNELVVTVDGQKQTIATVTTTADSALSKANVLETTVDGVTRTISSVQEIVDNQKGATRNYLKNSESPRMTSYLNANPTYSMNQSVPEWKATNAVRHKVLADAGDHATIFGTMGAGRLVEAGTYYVHSIYVSNVGSNQLRISNNLGKTINVEPGEIKRVVFPASSQAGGTASMQFVFSRASKDLEMEFILWHAMIADGTIVSSWVPNPDEQATVTQINTISETVDGHTQLIASTKTTADSALSKATQVETTANGLKTTISSVETTANSALSKALQVEATASGITQTVVSIQEDLNSLSETTSSQFTQLSDQMNFKLTSSDGGVTQIDIQNQIVTISSENIYLTGKSNISDAIIKTAHIADLAVSNGKIANLAVTEGKIGNLAVTTAKIADLAVNNAKIASLDAAKINTGYLAAARIAASSITTDKLNVATLSAITANLGTVNAGTINGVTINGSEFINAFSYTESGVAYTGTTMMKDGNVVISRTGSDGSSWTTKVDRQLGFEDSYKAGSTAPARTTRLGQGKLYMVESGVGGYLPASALNPTSWVNLPYASGWTTAENNPCQYRMFPQLDGSYLIRFRGQFAPTSGTIPSGNQQPFGAGGIPVAIRPDKTEFGYGASNQNAGGRLAISGAGNFFYNPETTGQTYCSISGISYYIG